MAITDNITVPIKLTHSLWVYRMCVCRYIGALGARVICDNIPGLVNKQRQLCQRHPDLMQSISEGAKEWIKECQHQFRHHRWNCSTLDRDHTVFGRVMLRSEFGHMRLGFLCVWVVTVVVYVSDTRVNHPPECLLCYKTSKELIGVFLNQLNADIQTKRESVVRYSTFSGMKEDWKRGCSLKTSSRLRDPHWRCLNSNRRCKYLGRCFWQPDKATLPDISPVFCLIA